MQEFGQQDVQIEQQDYAYQGFYQLKQLRLRQRLFEGGWSGSFQRELCVRQDAVGILLYDANSQQFALVEQMRVGVLGRQQSPWLLELVAGLLDKSDESEADVAVREAKEEAGLEVLAVEPMLRYFVSPGGSTEHFSLFCGKVDLSQTSTGVFGLAEENENIRLHIVSVEQALDLFAQGKVNNSMTFIALQWFMLNRDRLDAHWRD